MFELRLNLKQRNIIYKTLILNTIKYTAIGIRLLPSRNLRDSVIEVVADSDFHGIRNGEQHACGGTNQRVL